MTRILLSIAVLFVVTACFSQQSAIKNEIRPNEVNADYSIQYSIEVPDAKFVWYILQNRRPQYPSNSYYYRWMRHNLSEWNIRLYSGFKSSFFELKIKYDPNVDYGFDLSKKITYHLIKNMPPTNVIKWQGYHQWRMEQLLDFEDEH